MTYSPEKPSSARNKRAEYQEHYYYRNPEFYIDGNLQNDFAHEKNYERAEVCGDYFEEFYPSRIFPYRIVTVAHDEHYEQYGYRRYRNVRLDFEVSVGYVRIDLVEHYRSRDKVRPRRGYDVK